MKVILISTGIMRVKDLVILKISRSFFGFLKETGAQYECNGILLAWNSKIYCGDIVTITYEPILQDGVESNLPLQIIYENDDFLIVDKEADLLTIPSRFEHTDSVYNRLLGKAKQENFTVHILTRLDKATRGLLFIAKNQHMACLYHRDCIKKTYIAETKIKLKDQQGTWNEPIMKQEDGSRWIEQKGKACVTHFRFLEEHHGVFRYHVELETGRTHQIRIHFAYHGSPLLNDSIYGIAGNDPLGLICNTMKIQNPITNEVMEFESQNQ